MNNGLKSFVSSFHTAFISGPQEGERTRYMVWSRRKSPPRRKKNEREEREKEEAADFEMCLGKPFRMLFLGV